MTVRKVGGAGVMVLSILAASTAVFGDLVVLRAPNYINFLPGANPIESDEIGRMIAAVFGLPIDKDLKWNGLEEVGMFQRPKASCLISVSGVPGNSLQIPHVAYYKTVEIENEVNTEDVTKSIEGTDWNAEPLVIDFSLDRRSFDIRTRKAELFSGLPMTLDGLRDDLAFGAVPRWFSSADLGSLNITRDTDLQFVSELYMLKEIVNTLEQNKEQTKTKSPDFFHFKISGLEDIVKIYGVNSAEYSDALHLLQEVAAQVTETLRQLYDGNVVVQLVTFSPEAALKPSPRHSRSLLQSAPLTSTTRLSLNLAPKFSDIYAAIFNICLWIMVGFGLALFFISWGIWNMDPGRDSIIYRMTSTRMKRD